MTDPVVIEYVSRGVTISPNEFVAPWKGSNYKSTEIFSTKTNDQVKSLLAKGKIAIVSDPVEIANLVVNPLGAIPKKDSEEVRLVVDMSRTVNPKLPHLDMKLPGVDEAMNMMKKGYFSCKLDLKAAYLHLPINVEDQRLLGFCWEGIYYKYLFLPFGLSTAPAIWSRCMNTLVVYLRNKGIQVICYFDDFFICTPSMESCIEHRNWVLDEFKALGLLVNLEKCTLPAQETVFLGMLLDSAKMQVCVPQQKLISIQQCLIQFKADFSGKNRVPRKTFLSLLGKLAFVSKAVKSSRLFLRRMWDTIKLCRSKKKIVDLQTSFWDDFAWWCEFLPLWNGVEFWIEEDSDVINCWTDASNQGFGAFWSEEYVQGAWFSSQRKLHINCKELKSIEVACQQWGSIWRNRKVLFLCDNSQAVGVLNSGSSSSEDMMKIRRRIAAFAAMFNFDIRAKWIPGVSNIVADRLSRDISVDLVSRCNIQEQVYLEKEDLFDTNIFDAFRSDLVSTNTIVVGWKDSNVLSRGRSSELLEFKGVEPRNEIKLQSSFQEVHHLVPGELDRKSFGNSKRVQTICSPSGFTQAKVLYNQSDYCSSATSSRCPMEYRSDTEESVERNSTFNWFKDKTCQSIHHVSPSAFDKQISQEAQVYSILGNDHNRFLGLPKRIRNSKSEGEGHSQTQRLSINQDPFFKDRSVSRRSEGFSTIPIRCVMPATLANSLETIDNKFKRSIVVISQQQTLPLAQRSYVKSNQEVDASDRHEVQRNVFSQLTKRRPDGITRYRSRCTRGSNGCSSQVVNVYDDLHQRE